MDEEDDQKKQTGEDGLGPQMAISRPGSLESPGLSRTSALGRPTNGPDICASSTCTLTSVSSVLPHCHDSAHGETLELLKDRIKKRPADVEKAFRVFSLEGPPNSILQSHFRSVLDTFCFPLSDSQFRTILRQCAHTPEGTVDYVDFLENYVAIPREKEEPATYRCQQICGLSMEEAEKQIKDKVLQNVKAICLAFRMLDHNQDGHVLRNELKRIIENFCQLKFGEDYYQRLWTRYDPKDTGLIDYREFMKKLALNVSQYQKCLPNLNMKIALTWPDVNVEKYNSHKRRLALLTRTDDPCLQGLPFEQIEARIKDKIVKDYAILKRAFLVLDPRGTGVVPYEAFHSILSHFTHPMSEQLLAQIMLRHGYEQTANVCWRSVVDRLASRVNSKEDRQNLQRPITSNNFELHGNRKVTSAAISQILPKLSDLRIRPGINVSRLFNVRNANEENFITRQELRLMIEKKGNRLSENEIKELMVTLDPGHTNLISYSTFCALFNTQSREFGDRSWPVTGANAKEISYQISNARLQPISWEKLVGKLKSKVHSNYETIERALGACDYEQKGWIQSNQLRQIIHKFCFRMTRDEFDKLLEMVDAVDGIVSIRHFLATFRETERERLQKWSVLVGHLAKPSSPHPWNERRLQNLFREVVSVDRRNVLKDCQRRDHLGLGFLTRSQLRDILHKRAARLSDAEFEKLWKLISTDGNFNYVKFFEDYDAAYKIGEPSPVESLGDRVSVPEEEPVTKASRSSSAGTPKGQNYKSEMRPSSVHPRNRKEINPGVRSARQTIRPMTAIAGAAKADFQLCKILARRWREIKQECNKVDSRGNGVIDSDQFLDILSNYGVTTSSEAFLCLLQNKYHVRLGGTINYIHFLRDFFLAVGKKTNDVVNRETRTRVCEEAAHRMYSILLDLRNPILSCWKSLKKAFRRQDILGNGSITIHKFRTVLRDKDIAMAEDDFYQLAKYLDPDSKGSIPYNDFLRIFMKSVV